MISVVRMATVLRTISPSLSSSSIEDVPVSPAELPPRDMLLLPRDELPLKLPVPSDSPEKLEPRDPVGRRVSPSYEEPPDDGPLPVYWLWPSGLLLREPRPAEPEVPPREESLS